MDTRLWAELHDLFDTDDGSLPEVRVNYCNPMATIAGYDLLRKRANQIVTANPSFWSKMEDVERPLDSVPNAAFLVVSGEAEAFHVVLGGIQSCGVAIPDIGVFVLPHRLCLDYRMGTTWGPGELEAFFALLAELMALDPQASISLEEGVLPEVAVRFQQVWHWWNAARTV
jgi:hypothetical protein